MARLDKHVIFYLIAYAVILVAALFPQLLMTQDELFLSLNQFHSSWLDSLFYWITFFGDGLTFAILVIALAYFSYRNALLGLIIFLLTSGVAQFLKKIVFDDRLRPFGKLGAVNDLYIPDGVEPLINNSFPSGHTTTAFAMAILLVLILKQRWIWPIILIFAVLAGYSRIYLTHHFPIDVWTGSIIGTFGGLLLYFWLNGKLVQKFGAKSLRSR